MRKRPMRRIAATLALAACLCGCPPRAVVPPPESRQPPYIPPPGLKRAAPWQRPLEPSPARLPGEAGPWKPAAEPRMWKSIVIHHTATDTGSVESIHAAHLRRKDKSGRPWLGIGYHFVIGNGNGMGDGEIEPTFRWKQQLHGAHAGDYEHNHHGVGIALVGNFEEHPPSPAQFAAVKRLVAHLKTRYGINGKNVVGHSEIKATACPGRYFPLAEVAEAVPEVLLGSRP